MNSKSLVFMTIATLWFLPALVLAKHLGGQSSSGRVPLYPDEEALKEGVKREDLEYVRKSCLRDASNCD